MEPDLPRPDEKGTVPNDALRAHVTRTGFDLRLGKTHITAMIVISEFWAKDDPDAFRADHRPGRPSTWLTGFRGLEDRGLAWHRDPPRDRRGITVRNTPTSRIFGLTEAGEAVKTLLMEAGIWQEYAADIPRLRAVS